MSHFYNHTCENLARVLVAFERRPVRSRCHLSLAKLYVHSCAHNAREVSGADPHGGTLFENAMASEWLHNNQYDGAEQDHDGYFIEPTIIYMGAYVTVPFKID